VRSSNIVLLTVAVIALGIFAMPSTISLFAGQHTWYNLSDGNDLGGQLPCEKCHAEVANEMKALIGPHTNELGYGRLECEFCHRTFGIDDYNNRGDRNPINETRYGKYRYTYGQVGPKVTDVTPGKEAHAASTVPCMYCHSGNKSGPVPIINGVTHGGVVGCVCHGVEDGGDPYYFHGDRFYTTTSTTEKAEACLKCHGTGYGPADAPMYIPPAGGFGLTANASDTGELAAHKTFIEKSIEDTNMEDANEACIACHTHIPVKINWTHRYSLELNATPEFAKVPPTHFNVTAWSINGTYNITVYGWRNGTGNTSKEGWPGSYP